MKEFRLLEKPKGYITLSSPLKVFLDITSNCNLMCSFCYKNKSQSEVDINKVVEILERLSKANVLEVIMAGGEPFTLQDPLYVFESAKKLGLRTGFISNGTLISKKIAEKIPLWVDGCSISFHGPNAEIYEKLTGVKGSFDDAVMGIRNLNSVGMIPGILYTPTRINQKELYNTVEFLISSEIDFSCIQVNRLIPEGRACKYWSELNVDYNGYNELLQQMLEIKERWPEIKVETGDAAPLCMFNKKYRDFIVRCNYGITIGGIDEFGNFSRCPCRCSKLGNILEKSLEEIWLNSQVLISYRNLETIPKICKECPSLERCGGGCLCSLRDDAACTDAYLEDMNIHPVLSNIKEISIESTFMKLPDIPKLNTNHTIRSEGSKLLCIPIGVQEVFHDTIVPQNNEFPLLWIDKIERKILNLVNGERSLKEIIAIISLEFNLEDRACINIVKKTILSFIRYKYIKNM